MFNTPFNQTVSTVITTYGVTEYFQQCLNSVINSSRVPKQIYIINTDTDNSELEAIACQINEEVATKSLNTKIYLHHLPDATNYVVALNNLLSSESFDTTTTWLWLLHDDAVVDEYALQNLIQNAESSDVIGAVGAKQVQYSSKTLINVGYTSTTSGQRITLTGKEQVDQGQYSDIEDVLAVSLNGALIKLDVFQAVGGINPYLTKYNDSLDICRRIYLHGYRIVVASQSTVYHHQHSYNSYDYRLQYALQRNSVIYRLGIVPLAIILPFWFYLLILGITNALKRLYSLEKGALRITLGTITGLFAFKSIAKCRQLNRKAKTVPRRRLRTLYASSKEVKMLRYDKRMEVRAKLWENFQPTLLQIGQLKLLAKKRRFATGIVVALMLGLTVARFMSDLNGILNGGHFVSANLPSSSATAWQALNIATSGYWTGGFGLDVPVNPVVLPISLLAFIFGSVSNALTAVVLLSIVVAGLVAFLAAGGATRNNSARIVAAIIWVSLPSFTNALDEGRIGTLGAHILLPLVPYLVACALGKGATDLNIGQPRLNNCWALNGLVIAFLIACAPTVTPIIAIIFLMSGLVNHRFWFALVPAITTNIWLWIWVAKYIPSGSLQIFLGDLPLSNTSWQTLSETSWQTPFLSLFGSRDLDLTAGVCLFLLVVSAICLLITRTNSQILITRFFWFISVAMITATIIIEKISDANASVLISLGYLGFIITILVHIKERIDFKYVQLVFYSLTSLLLTGLVVHFVLFSNSNNLKMTTHYELPTIVKKNTSESINEIGSLRVLIIESYDNNNIKYDLVQNQSNDFIYLSDASRIYRESGQLDSRDTQLRQIISQILTKQSSVEQNDVGQGDNVVTNLRNLGIGGIYVADVNNQSNNTDNTTALVNHLNTISAIDATPNLVRIIEGDGQAFWRVDFSHSNATNVQNNSKVTDTDYYNATHNAIRYIEITIGTLILLLYLILSIPFGRRKVVRNDI